MVVRTKGKAAGKTVKRAGPKVAKKRTAKKKTAKKRVAKKAVQKGEARAPRAAARKPPRPSAPRPTRRRPPRVPPRRPPRPVVVVQGVPEERVRAVYDALFQIARAVYGLKEAFVAEPNCQDFMVSFLGSTGSATSDELNRVSGQRCDTYTLMPSGILAGAPEDEMLFTDALLLVRAWLENCWVTLLP